MSEVTDRIQAVARDARMRELAGVDDGTRLRLLAAALPLRPLGDRQARRVPAALHIRDAEQLLAGATLTVKK